MTDTIPIRPRSAAAQLPAVLILGLFWGLNWPTVKFLLQELPPVTLRAWAFPCAAILLALIAKATGQPLTPRRSELPRIAIAGLLVVFGFNVMTSIGQTLTETSKAAIIAYTMPALTAVLAALFLGERLTGRRVLALALGMAGIGVLAAGNLDALIAAPEGPAIMMGAALSWALGNVALKGFRWSLPPISLTVWFFAFSAVAVWPLALALESPPSPAEVSNATLAVFAWHVLGPMVTSYALWTMLVSRLPATVAAISTLTAPVTGVLSAALLLDDPLTLGKTVALGLVAASILVALAPARPARKDRFGTDPR